MNKIVDSMSFGRVLPLHAQIRETLRQGIVSGSYLPDDKLPSEKELMVEFGVSRITVRQALGVLEKEGIIYRVTGKGSFVSKPRPIQDLTRLQGFGEAMSDLGFETINQVIGLNECSAPPEIAQQLALGENARVTEIRRLRFVDRAPVSLDVTYVSTALGKRLAGEDLATRDIFLIIENDYGIALGHADLHISTLPADATVSRQLKVRKGAPVLHLQRLTYAKDGTPLEVDRIYYRGDSFSYRLRIERV